MSNFASLLLGIIQGFTEFLPVSSSGHLVITQSLIPGFEQPGVFFDTVLHAGTTLAVLFYFRKKIFKLSAEYLVLILIASVPAAFAGLFLQDFFEGLFSSTVVVSIALVVTGIVNLMTDRFPRGTSTLKSLKSDWKKAFVIGIGQACAITPGISRSGSTIFAGVTQKIKRKEAAEFSFLMSIPAILGANVLQIATHPLSESIVVSSYVIGFFAACISGILAIFLVLKLLESKHFKWFGYYCIAVGLILLIFL